MRLTDRLFSLFFMIVLGMLGYQTSKLKDLPYETYSSKLFPYLVIGFCLVLVAALFVNSFVAKNEMPTAKEVWGKLLSRRRLAFLTAIVIYLVLLEFIGFVLSSTLFLMFTILAMSSQPKKDFLKAGVLTLSVVGGVVLLVEHFLQSFLP